MTPADPGDPVFEPPFCPRPLCVAHDPAAVRALTQRFYWFCGRFSTRVPGHQGIRRFRCRFCRTSFSIRTFSSSRSQKKPHLNRRAWQYFSSGVSRRQAARLLETTRRTIERRFLFFSLQSRLLHHQSLHKARLSRGPLEIQFDEMESFVTDRFHPVSIPVMISSRSYFILDSRVASIRRKGTLSPDQKAHLERLESKEGARLDRSPSAIRGLLDSLKLLAGSSRAAGSGPALLRIATDQKPLYRKLIRQVLSPASDPDDSRSLPVLHRAHSGRLRRDARNPLFSINHTNAEHRYHISMLIRRSWCHAKREDGLRRHLEIYRVYRNFRRWRTNRHRQTPAMALGIARERLSEEDLFKWDRRLGRAQLRALGAVAA